MKKKERPLIDVGSKASSVPLISALMYCSLDFPTGNPQGTSGIGRVVNDFEYFVDLTGFGCKTDHS